MKIWVIILFLVYLPGTGLAADKSFAHPVTGEEIRKYAGDTQSGAQKNFGVQPVHDNERFAVFIGDRLEYQTREGQDLMLWDLQAWAGADYHKLWFKSEGVWQMDKEKFEEVQTELYYSRNIATFWDVQMGIRHDLKPDPDRTFAALSLEGLAPLWFEVETSAYISEDGDLSATFEAEYDLLLTQRLILQPRFETGVAVQEVKEYGVGQGVNDIELGLRLRYEIRREYAPYIGVSWSRKLGETADLAESEGEDVGVTSFVVGVKFWF